MHRQFAFIGNIARNQAAGNNPAFVIAPYNCLPRCINQFADALAAVLWVDTNVGAVVVSAVGVVTGEVKIVANLFETVVWVFKIKIDIATNSTDVDEGSGSSSDASVNS